MLDVKMLTKKITARHASADLSQNQNHHDPEVKRDCLILSILLNAYKMRNANLYLFVGTNIEAC